MAQTKEEFHKVGRVASLHLHPETKGDPMVDVKEMKLIDKGIVGNTRYFNQEKIDKKKVVRPMKRHVSIIEREIIKEHGEKYEIEIAPGTVRSNIETLDINLVECLGKKIKIGKEVVVSVFTLRTPCWVMDTIVKGLQQDMKHARQGIIAQVLIPGTIVIGDSILIVSEDEKE